jgi:hypothetical protein
MDEFSFLIVLAGIVTTIIWIIIGWRAMKAHERIAEVATSWMLQQQSERMAKRQSAASTPASFKPTTINPPKKSDPL